MTKDQLISKRLHLKGLLECCKKPQGQYEYLKGGEERWKAEIREIDKILKEKHETQPPHPQNHATSR